MRHVTTIYEEPARPGERPVPSLSPMMQFASLLGGGPVAEMMHKVAREHGLEAKRLDELAESRRKAELATLEQQRRTKEDDLRRAENEVKIGWDIYKDPTASPTSRLFGAKTYTRGLRRMGVDVPDDVETALIASPLTSEVVGEVATLLESGVPAETITRLKTVQPEVVSVVQQGLPKEEFRKLHKLPTKAERQKELDEEKLRSLDIAQKEMKLYGLETTNQAAQLAWTLYGKSLRQLFEDKNTEALKDVATKALSWEITEDMRKKALTPLSAEAASKVISYEQINEDLDVLGQILGQGTTQALTGPFWTNPEGRGQAWLLRNKPEWAKNPKLANVVALRDMVERRIQVNIRLATSGQAISAEEGKFLEGLWVTQNLSDQAQKVRWEYTSLVYKKAEERFKQLVGMGGVGALNPDQIAAVWAANPLPGVPKELAPVKPGATVYVNPFAPYDKIYWQPDHPGEQPPPGYSPVGR
jgi:hypothetical protein